MSGAKPPAVILARPQMGENIGAAARAMKNCGLSDFRLVAPRDGWPNSAAYPIATSGTDILESATVFHTLAEALHDITYLVATSARPRDMAKPLSNPRSAAGLVVSHHRQSEDGVHYAGLLFGAERSGLNNDELAMADILVQADLNPDAMSLNLAHAVLLMSWEWRMAMLGRDDITKPTLSGERTYATGAARDFFFNRLEALLEDRGFFSTPEMAPVVKRNLRTFFARGVPSKQELRTLHGILTVFEQEKENTKKFER